MRSGACARLRRDGRGCPCEVGPARARAVTGAGAARFSRQAQWNKALWQPFCKFFSAGARSTRVFRSARQVLLGRYTFSGRGGAVAFASAGCFARKQPETVDVACTCREERAGAASEGQRRARESQAESESARGHRKQGQRRARVPQAEATTPAACPVPIGHLGYGDSVCAYALTSNNLETL